MIKMDPNASEETKKLIDPSNQEPGHLKSGGIFVYKNVDKGIKEQGLNQKNISDALKTMPVAKFSRTNNNKLIDKLNEITKTKNNKKI